MSDIKKALKEAEFMLDCAIKIQQGKSSKKIVKKLLGHANNIYDIVGKPDFVVTINLRSASKIKLSLLKACTELVSELKETHAPCAKQSLDIVVGYIVAYVGFNFANDILDNPWELRNDQRNIENYI